MNQTKLTIENTSFLINEKKTYSDIATVPKKYQGLLMNARFIQGIFDESSNPDRFQRFGRIFDPEKNTDDLISALPEWYQYGLRAFTVGLQGGGPCFTFDNRDLINNPFTDDGKEIDPAYLNRLDRLIIAADEIGMIVIVSFFYPGQADRMKDSNAIVSSVKTASTYLKEKAYTNVIIEVCNEYDLVKKHPIICTSEGMTVLMNIAREASGGLPVGCSGSGGYIEKEVCENSDVVLIHGNGRTRQYLYKLIEKAKDYAPNKPIMCNEDSQAIGNMVVSMREGVSWGYYNNMTKQEPPADWSITKGEDAYFAMRMAEELSINAPPLTDQPFYLQGLTDEYMYKGNRWLRVASLYPESIDYIEFYNQNHLVYRSYDEPFSLFFDCNWRQDGIFVKDKDLWAVKVYLTDGTSILLPQK